MWEKGAKSDKLKWKTMDGRTQWKGRFHSVSQDRNVLIDKLKSIGSNQRKFELTPADTERIRKRKNEENNERKDGKRRYLESALN